MGKKIISLSLSPQSIDNAVKELEKYKQDFIKKCGKLQERVAEKLAEEARNGFNGAIVDELILKGGQTSPQYAQVDVRLDTRGEVTVIVAVGKEENKMDAVWAEFGTGVYYNGSPGSSPHPHGVELGMTIGGYGKGNGEKEVWGFKDPNTGKLTLTHGAPAVMPMARAVTTICNDIQAIAKEVFG